MASDGLVYRDLSATSPALDASWPDSAAGFKFAIRLGCWHRAPSSAISAISKAEIGSGIDFLGIGLVPTCDETKMGASLGWRNYALSKAGTSCLDASSVLFGMRWKSW